MTRTAALARGPLLLGLALAAMEGTALAQPARPDTEASSAAETEAEGGPSAAELSEARGLFEAGQAAFARGRFAQALEYFEQSYEVLRIPELLYNIGQAARRSGNVALANQAFAQYLEMVPTGAEADEIRAWIAENPAEVVVEPPPEATPDDPAPPPPDRDAQVDLTLPIVGIAASGVVVIGGVVLIAVAAGLNAAIENAPLRSDWSAYASDYELAPILSGVGIASLIVGVAGAATSVALLVTASPGEGETPAVSVGPGIVSLTWRL